MALVGSLGVSLVAKTDDFSKGMQSARRELKEFQTSTADIGTTLGTLATRFGAVALATLSLGAIKSGLEGVVKAGLELNNLRNSFTALTGSVAASREEFTFVRDTSNRLGLGIQELGGSYRSLLAATKGTSLEGEGARQIFTNLTTAGRTLGLSTEQVGHAMTALQQIISKGKVSQEELRQQLGEAIPGASQIAARAFGVTTRELDSMVEKGLDGVVFAKAWTQQLGRETPAAAAAAGLGIQNLGNEIFLLKGKIADSGVLPFLDRLAAKGAELLRGNREAGEQEAAKNRARVATLGVNPDAHRATLVDGLASINTQMKAAEANLARLLAEEPAGAAPSRALVEARQLLSALRTEQQALVGDLQQEGLERQRTGAIAAQQNEHTTARLKEENRAREAEADRVKARFAEISVSTAKAADDQAEAERTAAQELETGATKRVQLLTQYELAQSRVLQNLQDELDRETLTVEQLERKKLLQEALDPLQRQKAEALLEEIQLARTARQEQELAFQVIKERAQAEEDLAEKTAREIERAKAKADREELRNTRRQVKELKEIYGNFADTVTDGFLSITEIGKRSWKELGDSFVQDFLRTAVQSFLRPQLGNLLEQGINVAAAFLGGYGASFTQTGATGTAALGTVGNVGVPGLASGGPVMPGRFYTVGEHGPETLYSGSSSGYVYPGGSGGVVVNMTVITKDAGSFQKGSGEIRGSLVRALAQSTRDA